MHKPNGVIRTFTLPLKWILIMLFALTVMLMLNVFAKLMLPQCRVLVYEGYAYHRHVMPSYVYLANQCGIVPDVVTKGRPSNEEHIYPLMKAEQLHFSHLQRTPDFSSYDLILRATYYGRERGLTNADSAVLDFNWPGPGAKGRLVTVVHDAPTSVTDFSGILAKERVLVLCPQVASSFARVLNTSVPWFHFAYGYRSPDNELLLKRYSKKIVLVHGSPGNRDLNIIDSLITRFCGLLNFRFVLLGRELEKLDDEI
jgi:hypothetical protein